ncbi:hypothetical protein [Agromyces archimandritae]|uniref:Uncharacterized protein n=1 Tax=Agromyces archimandritae TaxID=2781962 RepID=A0A975IN04_9MICO|nr:hypothetical protein [Agromyces archimandritae]QTX04088.1 hypothetical protein G127AT_12415 [Agromyces archimandritae]
MAGGSEGRTCAAFTEQYAPNSLPRTWLAPGAGPPFERLLFDRWRRTHGLATVGVFLAAVLLVTLFFSPVWTAIPVPSLFRQLHVPLPTWG